MDSSDRDLAFVNNLATKYKEKSITKKDLYTLGGVFLLLAGVAFYQTVNAVGLQLTNIKLERTLAQYSKPVENQSPMNELPTYDSIQDVSLDFSKPLPDLTFNYIDDKNKICGTATLELPPTLSGANGCALSSNNNITFAETQYSF